MRAQQARPSHAAQITHTAPTIHFRKQKQTTARTHHTPTTIIIPLNKTKHSTGVVLLQKVAEELAYPSMTCPITGKPFKARRRQPSMLWARGMMIIIVNRSTPHPPSHARHATLLHYTHTH